MRVGGKFRRHLVFRYLNRNLLAACPPARTGRMLLVEEHLAVDQHRCRPRSPAPPFPAFLVTRRTSGTGGNLELLHGERRIVTDPDGGRWRWCDSRPGYGRAKRRPAVRAERLYAFERDTRRLATRRATVHHSVLRGSAPSSSSDGGQLPSPGFVSQRHPPGW